MNLMSLREVCELVNSRSFVRGALDMQDCSDLVSMCSHN